jgi:hypothetical protein
MSKKVEHPGNLLVTLVSRKDGKVFVEDMDYETAISLLRGGGGIFRTIYQQGFGSERSNVSSIEELSSIYSPVPPVPK